MAETISDCFPPSIRCLPDHEQGIEHRTVVEELYDGGSQRRAMFPADGRPGVSFTTEWLTRAQVQVVRDFLKAHRGQLLPFAFFLADALELYVGRAIGTSTAGPGQVIHLPFMNAVVSQVYIDGVPLVGGFTINAGAGTFDADDLVITGAQTAGKPLTADLTGRLRVDVRSLVDFPRFVVVPNTASSRFTTQISLQGV